MSSCFAFVAKTLHIKIVICGVLCYDIGMKNLFLNSHTHKILNNDLQNNMLNHSYMLISTDRLLINEYSRFVAQEIMCDKLCDSCNTCLKIKNHNHSDVMELPQNDKGIMTSDADKIVDDSYVLPMEGDKKIYILHNFDECSVAVQNKLLKTIEEPSKSVIFILTCVNEHTVLPTIRSRCKKITEPALSDDALKGFLCANFEVEKASLEKIIRISNGNLTMAEDYVTNSRLLAMRDLCEELISNMKSSADVLSYSVKIQKYKQNIDEFLNVLLLVVRDELVALVENKKVSQYSKSALVESTKIIEEGIKKHKSNCSINSVVEGVLMGMLEVKFKCQK